MQMHPFPMPPSVKPPMHTHAWPMHRRTVDTVADWMYYEWIYEQCTGTCPATSTRFYPGLSGMYYSDIFEYK